MTQETHTATPARPAGSIDPRGPRVSAATTSLLLVVAIFLALALNRLARHYGLDVPDEACRRRKGIRHWGSEDYRPTLDAWQRSGDQ